jgi:hypothetical protein
VVVPLRTVNPYAADFGLTLAKTTNITGFNDIAATAIVSNGAITTSGGAVSTVTTTATATTLTNLPAITTDWISAAGVSAAAVTKIQSGLSTYAGGAVASVTAGVTVTTNSDKTGYSLAQSFPTNFANLAVDGSGRVDLGKWLGSAVSLDANNFPNANARDWGGAAVSGGLPNTTTPPTAAAIRAEIDANSTRLDANISTRLAASSYVAPDNTTLTHLATALQSDGASGYQFTTLALANGPAGGGGGASDWSATERTQIRYRLGIDGTSAAPSASPALPVTVSDKTGFKLAADGWDAIVIETGVNARQAQSAIFAAGAGVITGVGTGTIVVKGGGVATTRMNATIDTANNRTAVTLTLPT